MCEYNDRQMQPEITEAGVAHKSGKTLNTLLSWVDDLVMYFVIFILFMSFVFRPVVVNGESMKKTLYNGDILLLSGFLYEPDYGDIIVISRENNPNKPLIKRVIALGGDTVDINYETNTVYVNGVALKEDYVNLERGFGEATDSTKYPYNVPENMVFVLGDNRGNSTDSRETGAIEYGQILGKAVFRIYRNTHEDDSIIGLVK